MNYLLINQPFRLYFDMMIIQIESLIPDLLPFCLSPLFLFRDEPLLLGQQQLSL